MAVSYGTAVHIAAKLWSAHQRAGSCSRGRTSAGLRCSSYYVRICALDSRIQTDGRYVGADMIQGVPVRSSFMHRARVWRSPVTLDS
jgi:hypothetical protein